MLKRKSERGQSAAEFGLIVTVAITMFLGMVQFGLYLYGLSIVENAARHAARMGSVSQGCAACEAAAAGKAALAGQPVVRDGQVVVIHVGANLRRSAGHVDKPAGDVLASVRAGDRGEVLAGPVTADGLRWWQVRFGAATGWIAETTSGGARLLQASP